MNHFLSTMVIGLGGPHSGDPKSWDMIFMVLNFDPRGEQKFQDNWSRPYLSLPSCF